MNEKISRKEFLEKGVQAAVAVAGITACGRLLSGEAFAAGALEDIKVGEDKMLLTVGDLKKKEVANFMYNGKKMILLYNGGEIRAFENICTHQGGPTKLKGDKLVCQWHGAVFDPLTGESIKPPAPKGSSLPAVKLTIKADTIFLAE